MRTRLRLIEDGSFSLVHCIGVEFCAYFSEVASLPVFLRAYTPEMVYRARVITLGLGWVFSL